MSLKTIIVHVDSGRMTPARLDLAAALAEAHGALLVGLHPRDFGPLPLYVEGGAELIEQQQRWVQDDAQRSAELFRNRFGGTAVAHEWREIEGDAWRGAALFVRGADLTIVGQANPEEGVFGTPRSLAEDLVFASGGPVLVVPYVGAEVSLRRVLVAWNGSREAARALRNSLPLLARAEQVTLLAVDPDEMVEAYAAPAEICARLARHGIKAEPAKVVPDDLDPGEMLLSQAADLGAELIVMGAWGHSRLRETVLGGVTRTVMRHMTVPVLMSH